MGLTEQQKRFVDEYLIDLNAKQAAIRAGYSLKTAQEQSSRLLSNVKVQAAIREAIATRSERTQVTQDDVLKELCLIAFSDINNCISTDESGAVRIKPLDKLPGGASRTIKKIKQKVVTIASDGEKEVLQTTTELEFYDKVKSLELTGKHLGMFQEKPSESLPKPEESPLLDALKDRVEGVWGDGLTDDDADDTEPAG